MILLPINFKKKFFKLVSNSKGFTLIELLLVIIILGVLAGVVASTINLQRQKNVANDGVKRSTIEKLVIALEAYRGFEGRYPTGNIANQTDFQLNSNYATLANYIQTWPEPVQDPNGVSYYTYTSSDGNSASISVPSSIEGYIRYDSTWGKIKHCSQAPLGTTCTEIDPAGTGSGGSDDEGKKDDGGQTQPPIENLPGGGGEDI